MSISIEMPKLSDTMTEGTLVKWRKKKGDKIQVGDILAEVETDKATMEMEAFDEGTLHDILIEEGAKIAVGAKMAILLEEGETEPGPEAAPAPQKKAPVAPEPKPAKAATPAASAQIVSAKQDGERVKVSPLAAKLAAERGVDLSQIQGTGPGGRIVKSDVLGAKPGARTVSPQPAAPRGAAPVSTGTQQRIPLSGMRKVIAERLLTSKTTIPHFYLNVEVDASELMRLRTEINAASEKTGQPKITVTDFILKATIVAATKIPKVNASFDKDAVIEYSSINLAVAVAIEDGLVTPVIRDAQTKTLREISEAVKDLATRARSKKLKPEEYQGGTITVSNLGAYGIDSFSAIINPPQAIILSVGAIVKKPVVNDKNEIVPGQRMSIGMSCDHRVVDGAIGAEYLAELRRLIENPTLMLI